MTDESCFIAALDADPANHALRCIFADFLEERGDPRAEGMRVLGMKGVFPYRPVPNTYWTWGDYSVFGHPDFSNVGVAWLNAIVKRSEKRTGGDYHINSKGEWVAFDTRPEAENLAALAWLDLTDAEKREILRPVLEAAT